MRSTAEGGGAAGWHHSCYTEYNYHSMITFSYQARDTSGKIVSGIQDALNEDNAVTSLMSRGLMVLSLQKKAVRQPSTQQSRGRSKKPTSSSSPASSPP